MEEGYPEEELAEDREVNEKVLGDEECDAREEDLGSEGEFGLIEAACELPGSPTSEVQYIRADLRSFREIFFFTWFQFLKSDF